MISETKVWKCDCDNSNWIRSYRCSKCSKPIPKKVLRKIFYEEIYFQNLQINEEIVSNHNRFWQKINAKSGTINRLLSVIKVTLICVCVYIVYRAFYEGCEINIIDKLSLFVNSNAETIQPLIGKLNTTFTNFGETFARIIVEVAENIFEDIKVLSVQVKIKIDEIMVLIEKIIELID